MLGACPAAAGTHSPTGDPAPQGMAVFEWYRLSQVNTNVNRDIVDAYEQVRIQYGNEGLAPGFAIPFWFDGTPEVPAVQFGESPEPKAATFHLIDMLRDLPEI